MNITKEIIEQVMLRLQQNHMSSAFVETKEEALEAIVERLKDGDIVGVGGSVTLDQLGLIPKLRQLPIQFLDRYAPGLQGEEILSLHRALFTSDVFISSSNALTMDGHLHNMDGMGNRVNAMAFGPKKVILVIGVNKIVEDIEAAKQRIRLVAAPKNCARLQKDTPCVVSGECQDCSSPQCICNVEVTIKKQAIQDRIHVILVNESLGY